VVVETACMVCPFAGGCTTAVVVVPVLSTATTCCGCPLEAACFFAWSIALSIFDSHPASAAINAIVRSGVRVRAERAEENIGCPLSKCDFSCERKATRERTASCLEICS
jgi:hypothetical protein